MYDDRKISNKRKPPKEPSQFNCKYCTKTTNSDVMMHNHEDSKHRSFTCRICNTKYIGWDGLFSHRSNNKDDHEVYDNSKLLISRPDLKKFFNTVDNIYVIRGSIDLPVKTAMVQHNETASYDAVHETTMPRYASADYQGQHIETAVVQNNATSSHDAVHDNKTPRYDSADDSSRYETAPYDSVQADEMPRCDPVLPLPFHTYNFYLV